MRPQLALDCRAERTKASSYTRVLQLLRGAAQAVGLAHVDWFEGRCEAPILWSPSSHFLVPRQQLSVIASLHDITPLLQDGRGGLRRWRNTSRFRRNVSRLNRWAARIITGSEYARRGIAAEFPELAGRLRVVPSYAAPCFHPSTDDSAQDLRAVQRSGLPRAGVLFLSALRRHKNWETLLRAWASLPPQLRAAHPLILAGDAARAAGRPAALARQLAVAEHIYMPGRIPESQLPALLRSAALFVCPSYSEGFGLPPLEAMACGTPVIASNWTSLPEVLGSACSYFSPTDTVGLSQILQETLRSQALRDEMKALSLVQAKRWNAWRTGRAMLAALKGLPGTEDLLSGLSSQAPSSATASAVRGRR